MSSWKASFSLMVLEIWTFLSIINYISFLTKRIFSDEFLVFVCISFVLASSLHKFFTFENKNKWRIYIREFSKLSPRKNRQGTFIIWIFILLLICNLIFSFYLLSKVDWKNNSKIINAGEFVNGWIDSVLVLNKGNVYSEQ
jgi:hypothetical protein